MKRVGMIRIKLVTTIINIKYMAILCGFIGIEFDGFDDGRYDRNDER